MSHNIVIPGGQSRRLPTAGKYCDQDIVVTAEAGGTVLPELSNPGTSADLMAGKELIGPDGKVVPGSFTLDSELEQQGSLIEQIRAALVGKVVGKPEQEKTIEVTENGTVEITPDEGYVLSKVTVEVNVQGEAALDPRELYQRVAYITAAEAETYPYIITDFYGDNESGMEIVASFPVLQDRVPMGSREDGSTATRFYCVYPLSTNSIYYGFNTGSSISCSLKVDTVYRLQTNFLNSRLVNVYDEDGNRKGGTSLSGTLTQQTAPVSIFGYHNAATGAISSKREYKLYSARCSQGHEVVRKYIPVRRKGDGEVGLYEEFSGTFWGNDAEVGAFAAGPDIDW